MNLFREGLKKYFSSKQLKEISSVHIGIGGAGGLGSNTAVLLTRCGFSFFEIIDADMIEASNLNRQQFFFHEIGQSKVETLKKRLIEINPDLTCITHHKRWAPDSANDYFSETDIVIEAFDQAEDKARFVECYAPCKKLIISGNGMAGLKQTEPLPIQKLNNIYIVGDKTNDAACGHPPLAPRVTACAAAMAGIVVDHVLSR